MSDGQALAEESPTVGEAGASALPRRLLDAFVSPAKMAREVAEHPRWVGALLVSLALLALSTWLIPPELFAEAQRRAALERGVEMTPMTDRALQTIHVVATVGSALAFAVLSFILSGLYTLIFAFILGDEGRFKQYLAIFSHASIVPALISVALAPLRVATGDAQFALSLASFFFFLPGGYWLNVLRSMDLTQIWSTLVVAAGARAIDRRRSFGSAAAILFGIQLVFALVLARFLPS
jgi:hypothetical protein